MYIYLTPSVGRNRAFVGGAEIRKLQEKTKTTMMTSYKYRLQNSRFFFSNSVKKSFECIYTNTFTSKVSRGLS